MDRSWPKLPVMALHLLKLCVGCHSIEDLVSWIDESRVQAGRLGRPFRQVHTTRMVPRRADEIVPEGSLYWVVKGMLACRQRILAVEPFVDEGGTGRCRLVLDPLVIPVRPRPCRPFQGWRYLPADDAPHDLDGQNADTLAAMPDGLRRELASLGLL